MAQHYLIGGDWGDENEKHSHHYQLELQLQGTKLDQHGYLVDIVDIETALTEQVKRYRNQTLNELSDFSGLNPSIEHFCRILCQALARGIKKENIKMMRVILWENEIAWASYQMEA